MKRQQIRKSDASRALARAREARANRLRIDDERDVNPATGRPGKVGESMTTTERGHAYADAEDYPSLRGKMFYGTSADRYEILGTGQYR